MPDCRQSHQHRYRQCRGGVSALIALLLLLSSGDLPGSSRAQTAVVDGSIEFVESVPTETALDLPDLDDAASVWIELIDGARTSLDIESFYFSSRPGGSGRLEPVLAAVARAAARGVRVRVLADRSFDTLYPECTRRLAAIAGIDVRLLDARTLWGGVQHAKGFVIDGKTVFLGSQNWDWRALEHIRELGAVIRQRELAATFQALFRHDWLLADDIGELNPVADSTPAHSGVTGAEPGHVHTTTPAAYQPMLTANDRVVEGCLAASPPHALPAGVPWDEPMLIDMIDTARDTLRVQLLSYNPTDRSGGFYAALDNALRRAAARGVQVRMILANWSKRHYMLPHIQSLAVLPNLEIRFTNIPEHSSGFVPYARVEHAKYLTADRQAGWLGTANWSRSYFHSSRNISLFLRGDGCTATLDRFFARSWSSEFAEVVDPCGQYEPPRRE